MNTAPLQPFGLLVRLEAGTALGDLDPARLLAWVDEHRVVLLRGARRASKPELVAAARRLGPLQPWSFGAVHEVKPKADPNNYLYTRRAVPLHWDGAFAGRAPRLLLFQCLETPPPGAGGETVFVDTTRVVARADAATRDVWRSLVFAYETARVAHYGGRFEARVLGHQYSFGPVRFKSRGVLQVVALMAIIFVGPMLLVARALDDGLPPVLGFVAYAAMQQGTIAINTAEDLPEDEEAGIRTSAVALGLRGIVTLALAMVALGGLGVAAWLGPLAIARGVWWGLAPLAIAWWWVVRSIGRLLHAVWRVPREQALEAVRAAARWMPLWITATAWGTLLAAWVVWRSAP